MKFDILEKKGCKTVIKVEFSIDEQKKELELVFADIQKNAAIDGFRKGHAPMEFVKIEFARTAVEKMLDKLIKSSIEKVIKEKNLHPIVPPMIEPVDYVDGKPFSFKLSIEEAPEFELKDYKKIKITKKIKKITDKEINDVLKDIQDRHSTLEDAGDVVAEKHHFLIADYDRTIDGKKIDKPLENQLIDLSHELLPVGFASGLVGMRAGESKTIETKISDKPAKFDVKVNAVKKKVLPVIDDEFAKDFECENVEQLKEQIKDNLIKNENEKSNEDMEIQIVESLLSSNNFAVPEIFVDSEVEEMIEKTKNYLIRHQSFNDDEFTKSIPAMKDKYRPDAEKKVRVSYMLTKIAKNENITVTDNEVNEKIEEMSDGDKVAAENYEKQREHIMFQIEQKKIFDFLLANAKVKEL